MIDHDEDPVVLGVTGGAFLAGLWAYLGSPPIWGAPLALVLPPAAIFVGWRRRSSISLGFPEQRDKRQGLGFVLFAGLLSLPFIAWRAFPSLAWNGALGLAALSAVAVGFGLALLVGRIDPNQMSDGIMRNLTALAAAGWALGGLVIVNGVLPVTAQQIDRGTVVDKYYGSRGSRTHSLRVHLWTTGEVIVGRVPQGVWRQAQMGETICSVRLHGHLRLTWGYIAACPT